MRICGSKEVNIRISSVEPVIRQQFSLYHICKLLLKCAHDAAIRPPELGDLASPGVPAGHGDRAGGHLTLEDKKLSEFSRTYYSLTQGLPTFFAYVPLGSPGRKRCIPFKEGSLCALTKCITQICK